MKLYTEEQVKRAIDITDNNTELLKYKQILSKLTTIELLSDKEVEVSGKVIKEWHNRLGFFNEDYFKGFTAGAKWVIEQIKQQGIGH